MSLIPESSPFPKLTFSFHSSEEILDSASEFCHRVFQFLNSNYFSFDISYELSLEFLDMGLLTEESLNNLESFFSGGFLPLKSSEFLDNPEFLIELFKKNKNYISSIAISFEKVGSDQSQMEQIMLGLNQLHSLNTCEFSLFQQDSMSSKIFFDGLLSFSQRIISLSLEFRKLQSSDYQFPNNFWSNFPFLKKIKLLFADLSYVPSQKSFFEGFGALANLQDFELLFEETLNNDVFDSFLEEFVACELNNLKSMSLDFSLKIDAEDYEGIINILEKKAVNLQTLSLVFSKNNTFVIDGLKKLTEFLVFLSKNSSKLETFALSLIECNLINEKDVNELSEAIGNLTMIKSLEINITNNKMPGILAETMMKSLEKLHNSLKTLNLFLGWNNINDEFAKPIFKELEKFQKLEHLLCDISQNYSGSLYMNGALSNDFIETIKKLTNLKTLLINFEGNEIKENNYIEMETAFLDLKTQNLEFYKIFRKPEIYGLSQSEPNLTYYKEYSHYFNENPLNSSDYNLKISNISIDFNNTFFENIELIKKFKNLIKNLRNRTKNDSLTISLKNPPFIEDLSNGYSLLEFYQDTEDNKNPFTLIKIFYTEIFDNPGLNPFNINRKSIKNNDKKIKEDLISLSNFSNTSMNSLVENMKNFEDMCINPTFSLNFTTTKFEEIFHMIPKHHEKAQCFFINQIFVNCLLADIHSKIPAFLLAEEEFSKNLSAEALSLLNFYCKTVNIMKENEIVKRIHEEKMKEIKVLKLKKNFNFSIETWKGKIFEDFQKNWKNCLLKTPKNFMKNEFFEIKGLFEDPNLEKANKSLENCFDNMKNMILGLNFPELNGFYQGFLEELVENLKGLEKIDFCELLSSEKLKEKFEKNNEEEEKKTEEIMENIKEITKEVLKKNLKEKKLKNVKNSFDSDDNSSEEKIDGELFEGDSNELIFGNEKKEEIAIESDGSLDEEGVLFP